MGSETRESESIDRPEMAPTVRGRRRSELRRSSLLLLLLALREELDAMSNDEGEKEESRHRETAEGAFYTVNLFSIYWPILSVFILAVVYCDFLD